MESAFKLYLKNGLTDVSMSILKKEANITTGGFYHYFPSKNALLEETMDFYIFKYHEMVLKELNKSKGSPKELLKAVAFAMMGHGRYIKKDVMFSDGSHLDYRQLHLLLLEGVKKFDKIKNQYELLLKKFIKVISKILDDGKSQGLIREDIKTEEFSLLIHSLINGTINLWIVLDIDLEERMEYSIEELWSFIKT